MATPKKMMHKCPSCYVNFVRTFCHMSCGAEQSNFLDIIKSSESKLKPGHRQVDHISYYMSKSFAEGMFKSCAHVQFPSGGGKVISLMCGVHAVDCTARHFFDYIGSKSVGPMQMDVIFSDNPNHANDATKSFIPMNVPIVQCNQAPKEFSNVTCSCHDCPQSCH